MNKAAFIKRIEELERKSTTAEPIHIVMKSYPGQSNEEAFEDYQSKRSLEGYEPKQGWNQLKKEFLECQEAIGVEDANSPVDFITFDILPSKALVPPKVTNAKLERD